MFLLKSISNLVWKKGNSNEEEVSANLVLISGSLFRFNANAARPDWQCIHLKSGCVIARTDRPFDYQFNVFNEEDEKDPGETFPISYSLQFARDHGPSNAGISWWANNSTRYLFEYDEELQDQMINLFELTITQCVFESETKKSYEEASEAQLAQCFVPLSSIKLTTSAPPSAPSTPAKQTNTNSITNVVPSTPVKAVVNAVNMDVEGTCELYLAADFYLFNDEVNQFKPVEHQVTVQINNLTEGKNFKYMLYVFKDNKALIAQEVDSEMHAQFYQDKALNRRGLVWLAIQDEEHIFTWCVLFENDTDDAKFRETFSRGLWEVNAQSSFGKNKDEDIDWIMGGYDDNVKMEEDDGIKDEDQMEFDEEEDEGFDEDDDIARDEDSHGAKNSSLAVGFKTDRSFVVRGSRVGVFKQKDSRLNFVTSIKDIKNPNTKEIFSPKKIMLHEADRSLLLLHPNNSSSVFNMDLERGQVIEEWKTDGQAIQQLVPEHKFAQVTPQKTLLAINNTGFLAIDPRLPGSKVIKSRNFQYNAGAQSRFSCAATTENGHMVVGSKKGTISLFSAQTIEGKAKATEPAKPIAKTLLPGFGDPIIGIDASADGKWILATCKTYLLVAPTTFDNNGERALGFEKRMGKNKPLPRRLQLKPEHLQRIGGKVSFTPARFNINENGEKWIATTTGPYIITWNFRKVKQNILDVYQIKKYSQTIIADEFRYNEDQSIVVAMPDDVAVAHRHVVKTYDNK